MSHADFELLFFFADNEFTAFKTMSVYHDEVEIEDFEYDEEDEMYYYPCPCGDRFQISKVRRTACCHPLEVFLFRETLSRKS